MGSPIPNAEDRAASWAIRLEEGPLSPDEQRRLDAFLAEHPDHRTLLAEFGFAQDAVRAELPAMNAEGLMDRPAKRPAPRLTWWGTGLIAAVVIAFAALTFVRPSPEQHLTPAGQRQELTLDDGSRLNLNARTQMAVVFRGGERHIDLTSGEVYFDVAKDPSRPFTVSTPVGSIRVTGTRFNVRNDGTGPLEISVLEGSVLVVAAGSEHRLTIADQLKFDGKAVTVQKLANPDDVTAWRTGRVIFDGTPLAEAAARFAYYHNVTIDVAPDAASLRVGGIFKLDDLNEFLANIQATLPIETSGDRASGRYRIIAK